MVDTRRFHGAARPRDTGKGRLPFDILYEDDDYIAIDKPAGLLSVHTALHGRFARESQRTAENILTDYLRKGQAKSSKKAWIVHRLDRETSGAMIFAKSREMAEAIRENWSAATEKTYIAKVEGFLDAKSGVFESYLAENDDGYRVRSVPARRNGAPPANAKFARTRWREIGRTRRCTMVEVKLDTGRKNQIRVHFAEAGHPVSGDVKYGGRKADCLCLHSSELRFMNPRTRRWTSVTARAPAWFSSGDGPCG
jgi:tRNA pseudouridine32 synthase/23S rRNA pseudouridine746 synthase/23S rRNA pseudouridine1911/1915/1917 synthase